MSDKKLRVGGKKRKLSSENCADATDKSSNNNNENYMKSPQKSDQNAAASPAKAKCGAIESNPPATQVSCAERELLLRFFTNSPRVSIDLTALTCENGANNVQQLPNGGGGNNDAIGSTQGADNTLAKEGIQPEIPNNTILPRVELVQPEIEPPEVVVISSTEETDSEQSSVVSVPPSPTNSVISISSTEEVTRTTTSESSDMSSSTLQKSTPGGAHKKSRSNSPSSDESIISVSSCLLSPCISLGSTDDEAIPLFTNREVSYGDTLNSNNGSPRKITKLEQNVNGGMTSGLILGESSEVEFAGATEILNGDIVSSRPKAKHTGPQLRGVNKRVNSDSMSNVRKTEPKDQPKTEQAVSQSLKTNNKPNNEPISDQPKAENEGSQPLEINNQLNSDSMPNQTIAEQKTVFQPLEAEREASQPLESDKQVNNVSIPDQTKVEPVEKASQPLESSKQLNSEPTLEQPRDENENENQDIQIQQSSQNNNNNNAVVPQAPEVGGQQSHTDEQPQTPQVGQNLNSAPVAEQPVSSRNLNNRVVPQRRGHIQNSGAPVQVVRINVLHPHSGSLVPPPPPPPHPFLPLNPTQAPVIGPGSFQSFLDYYHYIMEEEGGTETMSDDEEDWDDDYTSTNSSNEMEDFNDLPEHNDISDDYAFFDDLDLVDNFIGSLSGFDYVGYGDHVGTTSPQSPHSNDSNNSMGE